MSVAWKIVTNEMEKREEGADSGKHRDGTRKNKENNESL